MEKDSSRNNANSKVNAANTKERTGDDLGLLRTSSDTTRKTTSSDFVLQWGSRKRLRCMKVQVKDDTAGPVHRTTVRVDRRVVRTDKDASNQPSTNAHANNNHARGYFNLRQRHSSLSAPPSQRILRGECCSQKDKTTQLTP